jgi:hypothetical protein
MEIDIGVTAFPPLHYSPQFKSSHLAVNSSFLGNLGDQVEHIHFAVVASQHRSVGLHNVHTRVEVDYTQVDYTQVDYTQAGYTQADFGVCMEVQDCWGSNTSYMGGDHQPSQCRERVEDRGSGGGER